MNIQTELTPELSEKIFKSIQKKLYDDKISKETVLHHLKQLKAHMGKLNKKLGHLDERYNYAISQCMGMIDKKIEKIKAN